MFICIVIPKRTATSILISHHWLIELNETMRGTFVCLHFPFSYRVSSILFLAVAFLVPIYCSMEPLLLLFLFLLFPSLFSSEAVLFIVIVAVMSVHFSTCCTDMLTQNHQNQDCHRHWQKK
mmetsp:Transcript_41933/g.46689  ORF Transcript_41933/g.46689 Transcript_41933/m.46689 type:complete len:121 (+) Transcript_41933:292-654(+)